MGTAKVHVALAIMLTLMIHNAAGYEFKVGGSAGWTVPAAAAADSNHTGYKQWAENNRFQIGDTLLFTYEGRKDSVLYVTKEDYDNCRTSNPIDMFTSGYSVFKFEHSGAYYFISGNKDNCLRNEKIVVVVLADRRSPPLSPSPSPTAEKNPSPPPTAEENPSPGPNVDQEIPSSNTASSLTMSSIGAFVLFSLM